MMTKPTAPFRPGLPEMADTTLGWRLVNPQWHDHYRSLGMGETAEEVAERWSVGREDQDAFALESHRRALQAAEQGRFDEQITPVYPGRKPKPVTADNGPRSGQSLDSLAKLRPLFDRRDGTVTVANDNKQIAQQLVAVRSGSALLEQLRQIAPQGVQFQELSVNGDAIKVSGVVVGAGTPGPLERINALVLTLAGLPGSKRDGVKLVKATRAEKGDSAEVSFSLTWALDPEAKPSAEQLERLGATGMAARLRMLEQQGVEF